MQIIDHEFYAVKNGIERICAICDLTGEGGPAEQKRLITLSDANPDSEQEVAARAYIKANNLKPDDPRQIGGKPLSKAQVKRRREIKEGMEARRDARKAEGNARKQAHREAERAGLDKHIDANMEAAQHKRKMADDHRAAIATAVKDMPTTFTKADMQAAEAYAFEREHESVELEADARRRREQADRQEAVIRKTSESRERNVFIRAKGALEYMRNKGVLQ